jgi:hypothetical protein
MHNFLYSKKRGGNEPFKDHWSYVPPALTYQNSAFNAQSVFVCFLWFSQQTTIFPLNNINLLVFVAETYCVSCEVRTEFLYMIQTKFI